MEKQILGIIPGLQATALVGTNVKMAKDMFKSKKPLKPMMKGFATTSVGIGLMGTTSKMIGDLK